MDEDERAGQRETRRLRAPRRAEPPPLPHAATTTGTRDDDARVLRRRRQPDRDRPPTRYDRRAPSASAHVTASVSSTSVTATREYATWSVDDGDRGRTENRRARGRTRADPATTRPPTPPTPSATASDARRAVRRRVGEHLRTARAGTRAETGSRRSPDRACRRGRTAHARGTMFASSGSSSGERQPVAGSRRAGARAARTRSAAEQRELERVSRRKRAHRRARSRRARSTMHRIHSGALERLELLAARDREPRDRELPGRDVLAAARARRSRAVWSSSASAAESSSTSGSCTLEHPFQLVLVAHLEDAFDAQPPSRRRRSSPSCVAVAGRRR